MSLKTDAKLADKKNRKETGLFMVEGKKGVLELLDSDFEVLRVYVTLEESAPVEERCRTYQERTGNPFPLITVVSESALASQGTLESNDAGIAIAKQRGPIPLSNILASAQEELVLVLDSIQDPGNLGTIIRIADWFGITHIVTSETTADVYNPKVIRASMGSFTRVLVTQTSLEPFLGEAHEAGIPSYGAFLEGTPVYEIGQAKNGLIVMGSESHGIREELTSLIANHVTIPRIGKAESLNVGIATALILNEMRRHA